jgi:hypothetical protein
LKLFQDVRVLYVVGHGIGHRVVLSLTEYVEVVLQAHNSFSVHGAMPIAHPGIGVIQILSIFAHFHEFAFPLSFSNFVGCHGNFLKILFFLHTAFVLLRVPHILLVELSRQFFSVTSFHIIESALFGFFPLFGPGLFLEDAGLDVLFLEVITFVVEVYVVFGEVVLVVEQQLVVLL